MQDSSDSVHEQTVTSEDLFCLKETSSVPDVSWFTARSNSAEEGYPENAKLRSNDAESGEGGTTFGSCGDASELEYVGGEEGAFQSAADDMRI